MCIDIDLSIFFFLVKGFLFGVLHSNKHDVLNSNKQFTCIFQV